MSVMRIEIVTLTGERLPVRGKWTKSAEIDMQEMHGLDLKEEVAKFLFHEILHEVKQIGIDNVKSIEFIRE